MRGPSWRRRLLLPCERGSRFRWSTGSVRAGTAERGEGRRVPIAAVLTKLKQVGYYVAHVPTDGEEPVQVVLDIARSLGDLFVPADCDPAAPVIRTAPARRQWAAPFDRPEQIGWHGD